MIEIRLQWVFCLKCLNELVCKNLHFFYNDGSNSGYFKHDEGMPPKFGPDEQKYCKKYNDTITDDLDDEILKEAEKNVQERWNKENRQYNHPQNDCQSYILEVFSEYNKIKSDRKERNESDIEVS